MPSGEVAVTALLAEYEALRAEINRRSQAQQTLAVLCITASGAIASFALSRNLVPVLLLQPMLGACLGLLYADHGNSIHNIGRYLHDHTAARVDSLTRSKGLLAWERRGARDAATSRAVWLLPHAMIFMVSGVLALMLAFRPVWVRYPPTTGALRLTQMQSRILFVVDAVMVMACTAAFLFVFRRRNVKP